MRYHYAQVKMAKIQNSDNTKCWLRSGKNGSPTHRWWKYKTAQPHSGKLFGSFLKNSSTVGSNNCTSGHLSRRNETHVHTNTHTAQFTAAVLLPRWSLGGQSDGWLHQEDCAHGLQLAAAQRCTTGQCVTSNAGWQMPPKCQLCQVPARAANGPNVFQQVNS